MFASAAPAERRRSGEVAEVPVEQHSGPLAGVRVLELAGLGSPTQVPGPQSDVDDPEAVLAEWRDDRAQLGGPIGNLSSEPASTRICWPVT